MENGSRKVAFRMAAGVLVAVTINVAVLASGITFPGIGIKTGRLTVLLTDAPVELDALMITITDLEVHKVGEGEEEGGWINLIDEERYINEKKTIPFAGNV